MPIRARKGVSALGEETREKIKKRMAELHEAQLSKPYDMTDEDYYDFLYEKGHLSQTERDWFALHQHTMVNAHAPKAQPIVEEGDLWHGADTY